MPEEEIAKIAAMLTADPEQAVSVDLEQQTIRCSERCCTFTIDPVSRNQLLNGWDDVDLTENYRSDIAVFNARDKQNRPWATPTTAQT